jgi:protein phosphatase
LLISGITNRARKEGQNEDSFLVGKRVFTDGVFEAELAPPFFAAVADGVSGETSGDVASALALGVLSGLKPSARMDFHKTVLEIHNFLKMQGTLKNRPNMHTTLCACAFLPKSAGHSNEGGLIINVGDSRCYLRRGGVLKQLTTDQSLAQLLFDNGNLSKSEKLEFKHKNVILPALGNLSADPAPDITPLPPLLPGDLLLMCTDGFSDYVPDDDTEYILALPERLPSRVKKLYDRALMGGSRDNITVMAIVV